MSNSETVEGGKATFKYILLNVTSVGWLSFIVQNEVCDKRKLFELPPSAQRGDISHQCPHQKSELKWGA